MATETVVTPKNRGASGLGTDDTNRFQKEVSTYLDAGKDVEFYDACGNPTEIEEIHLSADGNIKSRNLGQEDSDAVTMLFVSGGWHEQRIHKIFETGTSVGLGMVVRMKQEFK